MISVLIPLYNGVEFIDESVESVKKQTFEDWKCIIGVNGHDSNSEIYNIACKYQSDKIKVLDLYNIKGNINDHFC